MTLNKPVSLRYVTDVAPARWIFDRLHPFAQDVGSIIPSGFASYARLFHPAFKRDGETERAVSWRDIAAANGRIAHPEMQFGHISGVWRRPSPQPQLWTDEPLQGSLPATLGRALCDVLGTYTSTRDRCWFAVWEGWGGLDAPAGVPTVGSPQRQYYLATGPLAIAHAGVGHFDRSASLWWPEDRAWCVTTEVDFSWTYVGGTQACIAAILSHPGIEALPARLSDRVTHTGDQINPAPRRSPSG